MEACSSDAVPFHDFLDRMRHPASLDLVRTIKSFLVSFSFNAVDSETCSKKVQEFFLTMETAIKDHPLWANATEEDIDCALEGLEKYVMTKLFSKIFVVSSADTKIDQEIYDKMQLLQTFLMPEHLDIPLVLHNQPSLLLAEKELQKINACKAPREKLSCVVNCCKVINNLLFNTSVLENHVPAGADDFLPILIYVTIKVNPPQLHSNLKFIQLYRRQAKLVSEAAYYFTSLVSATTFVINLTANSLSIDAIEFEKYMHAARQDYDATRVEQLSEQYRCTESRSPADFSTSTKTEVKEPIVASEMNYPYMEAEASELTSGDVERLLALYKDVVTKYSSLCKALRGFRMAEKDQGRASERRNDYGRVSEQHNQRPNKTASDHVAKREEEAN